MEIVHEHLTAEKALNTPRTHERSGLSPSLNSGQRLEAESTVCSGSHASVTPVLVNFFHKHHVYFSH